MNVFRAVRDWRSPQAWRLLEAGLYLALAVWATWPLAWHFRSGISQGMEGVATVPLFNLWTVWWNADRLAHGLSGYWNAPIFHPAPGTFAFSEPQPIQFVVAPLVWLTGQPGLAVNTYQFLTLVLNGLAGAWFCRLFRASADGLVVADEAPGPTVWSRLARETPPVLCGALFVWLPYVHWQLGVLQLGPLWGILLTLGSLFQFARQPGWRAACGLGIGFAVSYGLCANHGLFLVPPLAVAALCLLAGKMVLHGRMWGGLVLAAMLASAGIAPIVAVQRGVVSTESFDRPLSLMTSLSARSSDYTVPPWPQWISATEMGSPDRRPWWKLGVGTLRTGLALIGILGLLAMGSGGGRRSAAALLIFGLVAFCLSHGPDAVANEPPDLSPWEQARAEWPHPGPMAYRLLVAYVPGFGQVRNVFRFGVFVQITLAIFTACGVGILIRMTEALARRIALRRIELRRKGGLPQFWSTASGPIVGLLVGLAALLECRPGPQKIYMLPDSAAQSGWTTFVREELPDEAVLLCLPFVAGHSVDEYFNTTLWMYWQTWHQRRMLNGYSGFFPGPFLDLVGEIENFPSRTFLQRIAGMGATHLVIHRSAYTAERLGQTESGARHLKWLHKDDRAAVDVYELINLTHPSRQARFTNRLRRS